MDRSDFLKGMLALTGTAFVYGCKDVVEDFTQSNTSPLSKEAQDWFSNQYIKVFDGARQQGVSVTRKLNWTKQQIAKSAKHDFIWVPVEYEGDERGTALLMWKEGEEYVQKLAQYLSWHIAEGFLVYRKPNGDYDGFLAQIAFDPQKNTLGKPIDPEHFTGLIVNSDWNEKILRSWRFLDGKLVSYYNPDFKQKGGRTSTCQITYTQYTTVTWASCGDGCTIYYIKTENGNYQTVCWNEPNPFIGSDQGGYTGSGGYSPSGTGGYTPPGSTGYNNSWKTTTLSKYIEEIQNNLTNPCYNIVANKLFDATRGGTEILGEKVGNMMLNLMPESTRKKIYIINEAFEPKTTDGDYKPYSGYGDLRLNDYALNGASQEYIAATLIHELIHGLYHEQNPGVPPDDDGYSDHVNMSTNYVEPMADALVGLFGISRFEAVALAWGGLGMTPEWIAKTEAEKSQIRSVNANHKSGLYGTKCN